MKEKISWFYAIDKGIWGDGIAPNPYFATLSVMFLALAGACSGGGRIFYEWFDWNVATNNVAMAYLLLIIWGMNAYESVVASQKALTALWRSLLLLLIFLVVFAAGYIASVVVIVLVAAWLVLSFIGYALASVGSSGKKKRYELDDGTVVERESGLLGGTDTYREVGGSRTFRDAGPNSVRED